MPGNSGSSGKEFVWCSFFLERNLGVQIAIETPEVSRLPLCDGQEVAVSLRRSITTTLIHAREL